MRQNLVLGLVAAVAVGAAGEQTVPAGDTTLVARLGRVTSVGTSAVGLSWLGGGVRVNHTGAVLRATFAVAPSPFHIAYYQSNEGYMPFEGIAWVPASNENETVVVASGGCLGLRQPARAGRLVPLNCLNTVTVGLAVPSPHTPHRPVQDRVSSTSSSTSLPSTSPLPRSSA
jgi:hypothetical protein